MQSSKIKISNKNPKLLNAPTDMADATFIMQYSLITLTSTSLKVYEVKV